MEDDPRNPQNRSDLDQRFHDIVSQVGMTPAAEKLTRKANRKISTKENLLDNLEVDARLKITAYAALVSFLLVVVVTPASIAFQVVLLAYPVLYWALLGRYLRPDHPTNEKFKAWAMVGMAFFVLFI